MVQPTPGNVQSIQVRDRLSSRIPASPEEISISCARWHVAEISHFGSVLRDDFGNESDIDMLLEFERDRAPGIAFVRMAPGLSDLFGRPVDILTRAAVERSPNHIRRQDTLESAGIIFLAG